MSDAEKIIILTQSARVQGKMVPVESLSRGSHVVVECKCPDCGDTFRLGYYSVVIRGHTRCRSCLAGGYGNRIVGMKFGRLTVMERIGGSSVRVECVCGTVQLTTMGQLRSGKTQSCGCLTRERMAKVGQGSAGAGHWNWQGGKSEGRKRRSADKEHRQWSKNILERDRYVCDNCGSSSGAKYAHHLDAYQGNPEKRYALDNGVTLCKRCHIGFHVAYGQKCTAQDYADFKKAFAQDPSRFEVLKPKEQGHNRHLTWDRVRKLREWYAAGNWKNDAEFCRIASAQYGIHAESIRMIIKNQAWKE